MTTRQRTLWEQPLARNRDSVTSFEAADDLHRSSRWHKQVWKVFFCLRRNQGLTSSELSEKLDFGDRYTASRRLGDLRRMGLVCNGPTKRPCRVTGKRCLTWFIATNWAQRAGRRVAAEGGNTTTSSAPQRRSDPADGKTLTPTERAEFRRRMMAEADPKTRAFLEQFDKRKE